MKFQKINTWILQTVMWRHFMIVFVGIPTTAFIIVDPMCETIFSRVWAVVACLAIIFWGNFRLNAKHK